VALRCASVECEVLQKSKFVRNMLRRTFKYALCVLFALALIYLIGPRPSTDVDVHEDRLPTIGELSATLEEDESKVLNLIPETRKRIAWAGKENVATPIAFVYLHGFSDSNRLQGAAIDRIAAEFGANVFYARYAGHGYEDDAAIEALGDATLQMWADDTVEAFRIGRILGSKVVVIGFSTAAPLAAWASTQERAPDALVFVSPNFGLQDRRSELGSGPWGEAIVQWVQGEVSHYETPPVSADHERFATSVYDSHAIVTMMSAVKLGRSADLGQITSPLLSVFSPNDGIIAPERFRESIAKMSSEVSEEVPLATSTGHPDEHVLMGGIVSSEEATREVEGAVIDFVQRHVAGIGSPSIEEHPAAAE